MVMSCSTTSDTSDTRDLYKDSFKYFKNYGFLSPKSSRRKKERTSVPSSTEENDVGSNQGATGEVKLEDGSVLAPHPGDDEATLKKFILERPVYYHHECSCHKMWGLRSPETWNVVELTFPAGLIVIKNPFTPIGQRYWISRTLLDFPHHPEYITNMDNLNRLERIKKGEPVDNLQDFKLTTSARDFHEKLRWVTFGYHHDWDTKVYTEGRRSDFPTDLADMTRYISQILGFKDFEAEAAIANCYHMDSTLSGHVDRSEVNQYAPLFSLSFGQTAIFLIGGKTKAEKPQPVLLQSGDIAIMSGESRLSYHGVPKILPATTKSWEEVPHVKNDCKRRKVDDNTNADQDKSPVEDVPSLLHNCDAFNSTLKDPDIATRFNNFEWTSFLNTYINKSRINLNIRQVLFPGQSCLQEQQISVTKS